MLLGSISSRVDIDSLRESFNNKEPMVLFGDGEATKP